MFFSRKVSGIILVLSLSFFPFLVSAALGQDCTGAKDWKDVYILPTNPHPQSNIKISLSVDKPRVQADDNIVLTFHADRECYLTIMDVGTSGRILRLWPNDYSRTDNRCPANTPMCFPAPQDGFRYRIAGPEGTERIIAYATTEKGKILGDQEFRSLQNSGFKEYSGSTKDLAVTFQGRTDSLPSQTPWGTSQVNLCITGPPPPPAVPRPQPAAPTPLPAPIPQQPSLGGSTRAPGIPARPPKEVPAKMCVLALGVPTGNLKFSIRDAQMFLDALKGRMGVQESNVRRVFGSEATYDGIVTGIDWLASNTQPEDTAVVYFSGHGSSIPDQPPLDEEDGRDECFVLYHTGKPGDWRQALDKKVLLVDDEFNVLMKRIPARKKIIVVDACHSGTINKQMGIEVDGFVSKYYPLRDPDTKEEMWAFKSVARPTSYGNDHEALLSACLDNEVSYENKRLEGSVFTYFLVQAINRGAPDLETAFSQAKHHVLDYVREGVRRNPSKMSSQTPQLTDPHGLAKLLQFRR